MSTITNIGTLIVSTPGTCGGRPRIAGTRITVQNIAIDYNSGVTPEEIVKERPHLTLVQVYAALTYYLANKEQMEADIAAYYEECNLLEAQYKADKLQ
jgi:uncharacterized protein (DUF433 family)